MHRSKQSASDESQARRRLLPTISMLLGAILILCLATESLGLPANSNPAKAVKKLTTEELEAMSKELQKEEMEKMMNDAEKFKMTLASPRSNATEKVEAAAKLKEFDTTTRLELYKTNFKEALRLVLENIDGKAAASCGDMGVHRFNIEDKYLKENCKRAVKMVWGLLLTDSLQKQEPPFGEVKSKARAYLKRRLGLATKRSGGN